jgi:hypothetical protein
MQDTGTLRRCLRPAMGLMSPAQAALADTLAPDGASPAESVVRQLADKAIERWAEDPTGERATAVNHWLRRMAGVAS